MLASHIAKNGSTAWLVNTGWSGGPHGVGKRMSLKITRAILDAIHDGSLEKAQFTVDPVFGLAMPTSCANVPADVLNPRNTWADKAAYDAKATELAKKFRENESKFKMTAAVIAAGPRV